MSEVKVVQNYNRDPAIVWKALTDPGLVPLWTSTGRGGRPDGFEPAVGTEFRFIGKPFPGWDGIVRCEVLEVEEPTLLRYSWRNKETDNPTFVSYELEGTPGGGTRLTWHHTGFRGVEGIFMSRLLGRVRRTMLKTGVPAVLRDLDEHGTLKPGSQLRT